MSLGGLSIAPVAKDGLASDRVSPRVSGRRARVADALRQLRLDSPRLYHCGCCSKEEYRSFSPLADLLTERTAPELTYLENKFAAVISYGLTVELLAEVLPTGGDINVAGVYRNVQGVAERMEAELGEEKWQLIDGCQRDWDTLPPPGPPLIVGLDGGFIHAKDQKSRGEGWFEVIAGKSMPEEGAAKCFAYVQTYDTKPKRRLFELMRSQGLQANQQVTFLSDGADDVRELPLYLSPESEHWLDWFHVAMRLRVMGQMAKGLVNVDEHNITLSRVGLRCRECDSRLRRLRRPTRWLDEAYP
jgi:hypothetical protein